MKTIEEKAKAYDKALERANNFIENGDEHEKTVAESIFAGLRESDDERIRKAIFKALSKKDARDVLLAEGVQVSDALAYIEKQKEQKKPTLDNPDLYGDWDKDLLEEIHSWLGHLDGKYTPYTIDDIKLTARHFVEWQKQKEQKPNIELIQRSWYTEGYHDREFGKEPKWTIKTGEGGPKYELNPKYGQILADEQKPAEWSDKDKNIFNLALDLIKHSDDCDGILDKDLAVKWFAELPSRFVPQLKQEWSEDDEYCKQQLIAFCENCMQQDANAIRCADWLKRLGPSWKPSEEQMDILDKIYHYLWADRNATADMQDGLGDLINELKEFYSRERT